MSAEIGVLVYGGSENDRNHLNQLIATSLSEHGFTGLIVEGGMDGYETTGSMLEYINENNPNLSARSILISSAATIDEAAAIEPLETDDEEEEREE
jgi:hypothetical protein